MTEINRLSAADELGPNDAVPIFSRGSGDARRVTAKKFFDVSTQAAAAAVNALAATDGAAKIGTPTGTVQDDLDARPTASALAAAGGSGGVGFAQAGAGAHVMSTLEKLRQRYTLADYFEPSDGSAAMSNAISRVVAQASRQTVEIDIGDLDWTLNSDVILPAAKRVLIHGHGAINFAGGSLIRDTHNKYTALHGFKATGAYPMFKYSGTPSGSASRDFELTSLEASMNSGVWAVYLDGAREGIINKCVFNSGKGIYRTLSNICYISNSLFLGLEFALYDDGKSSAFSCGTNLSNSEILGCNRSVVISECDDGEIVGCTIDYNDEGIYLLGQDGLKIFGGYIGTRTAQAATPNVAIGGVTAALNIQANAAATIVSEKITVDGAHFTGHHLTDNQYDNIYVENSAHVTIANSSLQFYTRNAVRYGANVTYLNVHGCPTANRGGTATLAFECTGADSSTNRVHDNDVNPGQGMSLPLAKIYRNSGFLTENQGQAFAAAGASSFVVTHSLAYTPQPSDISFSPMNLETAQKTPYLAEQTATTFTVNLTAVAASTVSIGWAVKRR